MEIAKVDLPPAVDGQADIPTGHPWLPSLYLQASSATEESRNTRGKCCCPGSKKRASILQRTGAGYQVIN